MANAYRGEAAVEINGEPRTICFDWSALASLRTEFGEEWVGTVGTALNTLDVEIIARILVIGLQRHHGDEAWLATPELIMEASPALSTTVSAIEDAMTFASWGPKGPPEDKTANPPMARLKTLLSQAFGSPAKSASSRASSGS